MKEEEKKIMNYEYDTKISLILAMEVSRYVCATIQVWRRYVAAYIQQVIKCAIKLTNVTLSKFTVLLNKHRSVEYTYINICQT